MSHLVSVSQLRAKYGKAFFNVEEDIYRAVAIWGNCYSLPTYLLRKGAFFWFIQFDDQFTADKWLDEWLKENPGYQITCLSEEKK